MTQGTGPALHAKAFTCPHCKVYSSQVWDALQYYDGNDWVETTASTAECAHCKERSFWVGEMLVWPDERPVEPPNQDLNPDIQADYAEAASILTRSPRGAAALLRLAVQKLMRQLGEGGKDINSDIASLVRKGLDAQIQQALDFVRVVGNNAVHPGQMALEDDTQTAKTLFWLVNSIAEDRISGPRRIAELYASLPETARRAVERRDYPGQPST